MKYFDSHFNWYGLQDKELTLLLGFTIGRVRYQPEAHWLYSLRLALVFFKIEILWTT